MMNKVSFEVNPTGAAGFRFWMGFAKAARVESPFVLRRSTNLALCSQTLSRGPGFRFDLRFADGPWLFPKTLAEKMLG